MNLKKDDLIINEIKKKNSWFGVIFRKKKHFVIWNLEINKNKSAIKFFIFIILKII